MEAGRERYIRELDEYRGTGLVKIVAGIRGCGKSYLLFRLYRDHLVSQGVDPDDILCIPLEDPALRGLREPSALYDYVVSRAEGKEKAYVMIDGIQELPLFIDVLNGFASRGNLDIYVICCRSEYLSSDIPTEFRGRGHVIRLYPLTFSEYLDCRPGNREEVWDEYLRYGGMPGLLELESDRAKTSYLQELMSIVYLNDMKNRFDIRMSDELEVILDLLCSSTGSLTNPKRIADSINTEMHRSIDVHTIDRYISIMLDSFMFEKASRYDLKGGRYLRSPCKFYPADIGLRNARLNFRQIEKTHLMEAAIYLELRSRGYPVDVGMVEARNTEDGKQVYRRLEIDFVVNSADVRYYVQSALSLGGEKKAAELRPFRSLDDSFKKILVTADPVLPYHDDEGILIMNVLDFLTDQDSLDR